MPCFFSVLLNAFLLVKIVNTIVSCCFWLLFPSIRFWDTPSLSHFIVFCFSIHTQYLFPLLRVIYLIDFDEFFVEIVILLLQMNQYSWNWE